MRRIGHVHLEVSDLERSVAFYEQALGLGVTERIAGRFAFLSFGAEHHDLALQAKPGAAPPGPDALGMYHLAVEVDDEAELAAVARRLQELGVRFSPVDHGISKALYLADPDGHGVEVYCDTRAHGRELWGGVTEPLDVAALPGGGAGDR